MFSVPERRIYWASTLLQCAVWNTLILQVFFVAISSCAIRLLIHGLLFFMFLMFLDDPLSVHFFIFSGKSN